MSEAEPTPKIFIHLRQPEPKVASKLADDGHPILAFILGLAWVVASTVPCIAGILYFWLR